MIWIFNYCFSPNKTNSNIRRKSRDGKRLGSKIFDSRHKTWYTIYKEMVFMGKKLDLIGKKFGKLTVIEEIKERDKQGKIHYLCRCDCGNIKDVKGINLTKGKTTSCGCSQYESMIKDEDYIGKRFGMFTVLSKGNCSKIRKYVCQCDCGNIVEVNVYNLKDGRSTNCGCVRNSKLSKLSKMDLVGMTFGRLTVIKQVETNSNKKICYLCKCECGNTCKVVAQSLTTGHTKSCGCTQSHGNETIGLVLTELGIEYQREKQFDINSEYMSYMRLDFFIPKYNVAIEYDGVQHFQSIKFFGGDEGLKLRQIMDREKDNRCIELGIKLIRIPYTEFSNIKDILSEIFYTNND